MQVCVRMQSGHTLQGFRVNEDIAYNVIGIRDLIEAVGAIAQHQTEHSCILFTEEGTAVELDRDPEEGQSRVTFRNSHGQAITHWYTKGLFRSEQAQVEAQLHVLQLEVKPKLGRDTYLSLTKGSARRVFLGELNVRDFYKNK